MPRSSDARSRFITTAAMLFRRAGYDGVGLSEIIAAAQAPKGSFYHHFPGGKEELGEHAMRWGASFVDEAIEHAFSDAPDIATGVRSMSAALARWIAASGYQDGCPITGIAMGASAHSDRLAQVAAEILERWVARVAQAAEGMGYHPAEARAVALNALCALEGAWVVARVTRSDEPFRRVADLFAQR